MSSIVNQINKALSAQAKFVALQNGDRTYCIKDEKACPGNDKACKINIPGSQYNGKCFYKDTPYNTNIHDFKNYNDKQKEIWTCKAGRNAKWQNFAPNKPAGNTWWIDKTPQGDNDDPNGYCTNDIWTIVSKGKCTYDNSWWKEIDMVTNQSAYFCRDRLTFGKYNSFELKPGSEDYIASLILDNIDLKTHNCWQDK